MSAVRWQSRISAILCALLLSAPHLAPGQTVADAREWSYRIVEGDTLIGVSSDYLADPDDWPKLQRLNQIDDPRRLTPGSLLRIPVDWLRRAATVAEVVFSHGEVVVLRGGAGPAAALQTGATLRAGDTIRTGIDSSLTLRFADGSRLWVVQNSQVTIAQLLAIGKPGIPLLRFGLDKGGADAQVVPRSNRDTNFEITTPAVNLGVRGTGFRAALNPDGATTRVEVIEGSVAASAELNRVRVDAGFGVVAERGKPLTPPRRLINAPDLASMTARLERVPLRLSWQRMAGATGYRAQVFAIDSDDKLLLDGRFDESAAKWADLPDGRYRLRVRAIDEIGLEGLAATATFELKARPEPPFTVAPRAGAVSYGDSVSFGWTRSGAAARYRLQLSATPDFAEPALDLGGLETTSHGVALAPGSYHWRMASITAGGDQGPFGDAQVFTLRPIPPSPALEPAKASEQGIVFRWQAPQAGAKVQYQVARDGEFGQIVLDETSDAAQALLESPAAGSYFLRIRTIDADGFAGNFGATQQIEVPHSKWWLLVPASILLLLFL